MWRTQRTQIKESNPIQKGEKATNRLFIIVEHINSHWVRGKTPNMMCLQENTCLHNDEIRFSPVRVAIIKRQEMINSNQARLGAKGNLYAVGCELPQRLWKQYRSSSKGYKYKCHMVQLSQSGGIAEEIKPMSPKTTLHSPVHHSTRCTPKIWKWVKCPWMDEWMRRCETYPMFCL